MEDIWSALTRYHREVVQPDNDATANRIVTTLRNEMDNKFDRTAAASQIDELKAGISDLKRRVADLEARL